MLGCGQLCPQLEDASKLQDPRFDVRCRSLHQHTHACLYLTPTEGERGAALPRRTGRAGRPSSGRRVRGGRATPRRARCRPPPLAAGRAGRPAGPAGTRRACRTAGAGGGWEPPGSYGWAARRGGCGGGGLPAFPRPQRTAVTGSIGSTGGAVRGPPLLRAALLRRVLLVLPPSRLPWSPARRPLLARVWLPARQPLAGASKEGKLSGAATAG
jgi:hypothetical protein